MLLSSAAQAVSLLLDRMQASIGSDQMITCHTNNSILYCLISFSVIATGFCFFSAIYQIKSPSNIYIQNLKHGLAPSAVAICDFVISSYVFAGQFYFRYFISGITTVYDYSVLNVNLSLHNFKQSYCRAGIALFQAISVVLRVEIFVEFRN